MSLELLLLMLSTLLQFIKPDFLGLSGPPNFVYHKFSQCASEPTRISINVTSKWDKDRTEQLIDADLKTQIPMGNNLLVKIAVFTRFENKWLPLGNISCTVCQLLRNYIGPARKACLASIGLSEDTCPIPEGTYHARHVKADMNISRLPVVPYELFKAVVALYSVHANTLEGCLRVIFENKPLSESLH